MIRMDFCGVLQDRFNLVRVSEGFAWIISAMVPLTTGADMLVPLWLR
jgi:hypothetical protein